MAARFTFEQLMLHRLQVAIVPRNAASLRVVEKLGLRREGLAERYLEINGVWEDHYRFAITAEEWKVRASELIDQWIVARSADACGRRARREPRRPARGPGSARPRDAHGVAARL